MLKQAIEGKLVDATETHYITIENGSVNVYHKDWYRLTVEREPQVFPNFIK